MTAERKRLVILTGLVAIVGAIVIADRLMADGDDATAGVSRRAQYMQQAELVAEMRQFIDSREAWEQAQRDVIAAWSAAQERIIAARTAELANAELQRKISAIVNDLGITVVATGAPSVRTPSEDQPIRVIGLRFTIEAVSPEAVFALVDRIENLPDAWCHVELVQIIGPRRTPVSRLDVDIELEALALITTEALDVAG